MTMRLLLAAALTCLSLACAGAGGTSTDAGPDLPADLATDPDADTAAAEVAEPAPDVPEPLPEAIDPGPEAEPEAVEPVDAAETTPDVTPPDSSDVENDVAPDDWHLQYGAPCPLDRRVGLFEVGVDTYGLAAFTGSVADRVNPLQVLEAKESEGPCVLLERPNPFCDPPCPGSEQCAAGNQCVPFPVNQGVGTVTVTGLLAPLALEPDGQEAYSTTDFDGTPFAPGANLELTAAGGDLAGFSLQGEGVPLLALPTKNWPLHAGDPVTIQWTPGNGVGTIRLNLNVDQHGVTPVTLVCDVPDTGSYTVPGTLTAALAAHGISGAPSSSIVRRTVDSLEVTGGCVEFVVSHRVKTLLKVQ
jgi:hypothetical protein